MSDQTCATNQRQHNNTGASDHVKCFLLFLEQFVSGGNVSCDDNATLFDQEVLPGEVQLRDGPQVLGGKVLDHGRVEVCGAIAQSVATFIPRFSSLDLPVVIPHF